MTTVESSRPPAAEEGIVTPEGWAKLAVHTVTLPSRARVKVRIPDLSLLIAHDAIPENLRGAALQKLMQDFAELQQPAAPAEGEQAERPSIDKEKIQQLASLHFFLVSEMLVEPKLTAGELEQAGLPNEDLELLVQLATRDRDTDALGVVLGVVPLSRFARFREHHGCDESCQACAAVVEELSTRSAGGV